MRPLIGFLAVNLWLTLVGLGVLRALGLLAAGDRREAAWAIGPGFLVGVACVCPLLCVGLVIGIPLTPITALMVGAAILLVGRRVTSRSHKKPPVVEADDPSSADRARTTRLGLVVGVLASGVYVLGGFYAFARSPTRIDDARIWSLRGLTLLYHHGLTPEIFRNPGESGGHPVYPLVQPVLEAIVSEAMGSPQPRAFHAELWLLVAAAVWTAGFLIARASPRSAQIPAWIGPLALIALTPFVLQNVDLGDADMTAGTMLGAAVITLALWHQTRQRGYLGLGAILLAAAANTKDEELLATIVVLFITAAATLHRSGRTRDGAFSEISVAIVYVAALILPWRVWTAAHHLSDSVQPPIPRALSPVYLVDQHHLNRVITSMLHQTLQQWSWLTAIFLVTCGTAVLTRAATRLAVFYLAVYTLTVTGLVWLYATTPLSLSFLIPTSMSRVVSVFMVPAGFATAHLVSMLLNATGSRPEIPTRPG